MVKVFTMTNVIGPFTTLEWNTLRLLLASIKWHTEANRERYSSTIRRHRNLYYRNLNKHLTQS